MLAAPCMTTHTLAALTALDQGGQGDVRLTFNSGTTPMLISLGAAPGTAGTAEQTVEVPPGWMAWAPWQHVWHQVWTHVPHDSPGRYSLRVILTIDAPGPPLPARGRPGSTGCELLPNMQAQWVAVGCPIRLGLAS